MKKLLSLLLAMAIVLSLSTVVASAREKTGSAGPTSTFIYDTETKRLVVSGTGLARLSLIAQNVMLDEVREIVFEEGLSQIADLNCFGQYGNNIDLEAVYFPTTLSEIFNISSSYSLDGIQPAVDFYLQSLSRWLRMGTVACTWFNIIGANYYFDSEIITDMVVPEDIKVLDMPHYSGNPAFKTITIPETVKTIEHVKAENCTEKIIIESPTTKISDFFLSSFKTSGRTQPLVIDYYGTVNQWNEAVILGSNGYSCLNDFAQRGKLIINYCAEDHIHDYELVSQIEPTCAEDGGYFYKCKFCDDTYSTKDKHQISDWYILQPGTETEEGILARKCDICGKIMEQTSTIQRGICGPKSEYELNIETGLATVSGTGSAEIAYLIDSEHSRYLKDVVFEEGITWISAGDFYGNIVRINSVTIPSSVTYYSAEADRYMPANKIIVKDLARFCQTNLGNEFSLLGESKVLYYNGEAVLTLEVPTNVYSISPETFMGYISLTDVVFPENSNIYISNSAFANCKNLKSVTFRDPDAFAERGAFSGCTALTDVYYYGTPEQLQELLEQADTAYDKTIYETATIHYCSASVNNGFVSDISFEPSINYKNRFSIKVNDRPNMVQFMELDCGNGTGTRSFDRFNKNVSIVSYDKDGNVVSSISADLAYEIWTIETPLADGNIGVRVKASGSSKWESQESAYIFENTYAEPKSVIVNDYLVRDSGPTTPTAAVIETTNDISYVQLKFDDGSTVTYSKDKATLNENGNLVFNMKVWITHSGENIVTVRILTAKGWQTVDSLTYFAE